MPKSPSHSRNCLHHISHSISTIDYETGVYVYAAARSKYVVRDEVSTGERLIAASLIHNLFCLKKLAGLVFHIHASNNSTSIP